MIDLTGAVPVRRVVTTSAVDKNAYGGGPEAGRSLYPAWSWDPDGKRIYYERGALGSEAAGTYVIRPKE